MTGRRERRPVPSALVTAIGPPSERAAPRLTIRGSLLAIGDAIQGEARLMVAAVRRLAFGREALVARTMRSHGQDPHAAPTLLSSLSDPDPKIRARALDVLAIFSAERSERDVTALLWDPDPGVRRAAAAACGRMGTSRASSALILAMDDPDPIVRQTARTSFHALTGRPLPVQLSESGESRRPALVELRCWWKEQRLAELLRDTTRRKPVG